MAKSIHERVRAQLEKKAREEQRKADREHDAAMLIAESADIDYERGFTDGERDGGLNAPLASESKAYKRGYSAGIESGERELMGDY